MPRWEVESRGAVAVLTFTRPPRNFMRLIARPRFDGLRGAAPAHSLAGPPASQDRGEHVVDGRQQVGIEGDA